MAAAKAVTKYHALVAVRAGAVAILGCSLPTLISRKLERDTWRRYADNGEGHER